MDPLQYDTSSMATFKANPTNQKMSPYTGNPAPRFQLLPALGSAARVPKGTVSRFRPKQDNSSMMDYWQQNSASKQEP